MIFFFLPFALFISVTDLKSHRISNLSLAGLAGAASIFRVFDDRSPINSPASLSLIFLGLISLWRWAGLGMGDVKYLLIIFALLLPPDLNSIKYFTTVLSAFLLIHLLIEGLWTRSISQSLPLAPAISLAVLLSLSA